jgi:hypothetical protein
MYPRLAAFLAAKRAARGRVVSGRGPGAMPGLAGRRPCPPRLHDQPWEFPETASTFSPMSAADTSIRLS